MCYRWESNREWDGHSPCLHNIYTAVGESDEHNVWCATHNAGEVLGARTYLRDNSRHVGEILWVTDSVTNLTFSLAEVPVLFKDLSWSSELSWAMLQKNLGWFMILGRNHVRLGSSTWGIPQTRQKLAVSTKFHFDSKAMGLSVPLFPAQLNLLRASHKAKRLSHKTSFLRTARLGL